MLKNYRVLVFGKRGCDKCALLNQRLDALLATEPFGEFEKRYHDLETEEGLVHFAEAECVNPQQIPAMLVTRRDPSSDHYEPVPNPCPGEPDPVTGRAKLHQFLGLRTDYSDEGRGVLSPRMIEAVLREASGQ